MSARSINLLPDAIVVRHEQRLQARKWAPVWLCAAALLLAAQVFLQWRVADAKLALEELHERVRPLYRMAEQINALHGSSTVLASSVSQRLLLEQTDIPLAMLHTVALACGENEIELDLFRLEDAGRSAAHLVSTKCVVSQRWWLAPLGSHSSRCVSASGRSRGHDPKPASGRQLSRLRGSPSAGSAGARSRTSGRKLS